jgi:4-aminobutyrate aminotransferase / (S)-3-amino-2-methylpropionate transaminase / 5-aminovalerate transaminase
MTAESNVGVAGGPAEPPGFGRLLPAIAVEPPGPNSRAQVDRLAQHEGPAISTIANGDIPIVWHAAAGSNVLDVDGNVYIDTTSAFGVAGIGHRHPAVVAAVQEQTARLMHGMGDFLPFSPRSELAVRLAALAPMRPAKVLFGLSGSDAVELALKVAAAATGRPGVIAFDAAFHGQSYGALPLAGRSTFRDLFSAQLGQHVLHAPYPYPYRFDGLPEACAAASLAAIEVLLDGPPPAAGPVGAVIIEPVAGREGEIVPPAGFLKQLAVLCRSREVLLIADEIYTGLGRTGRMFAVDHAGVVPDLMCIGKALGGGMPISAVVGRAELMDAWRPVTAEAPHSSTFLGHPVSAAAALAVLDVLDSEQMAERAAAVGGRLRKRLAVLAERHAVIGEVRGLGMMFGIELVRDRDTRAPAPDVLGSVLGEALRRGVILLPGGMHGNVISLGPPFTMTEDQLEAAVSTIDEALTATGQ